MTLEKSASLLQRDARLAQTEELKERILADRCGMLMRSTMHALSTHLQITDTTASACVSSGLAPPPIIPGC